MLCEGLEQRCGERQGHPWRESLFPYSLSPEEGGWGEREPGMEGPVQGCGSAPQWEGGEKANIMWSSGLPSACSPSCLRVSTGTLISPSLCPSLCLGGTANNASLLPRGRCRVRIPINIHQTEGLRLRGCPSSNTSEHRMFSLTPGRSGDVGARAASFYPLVPFQMKQKFAK